MKKFALLVAVIFGLVAAASAQQAFYVDGSNLKTYGSTTGDNIGAYRCGQD